MDKVYRDKDWLQEHYVVQELSPEKCGNLAGCDGATISNWLRRFGILRRTLSEASKASWARGDHDSEETRQKKSDVMKAAHARGDWDSEETRQKMSEGQKAAHARGVWDSEETRQKRSDAVKAAHARGDFDGVIQSPNRIEIAIALALDKLGIMHVGQYRPEGCRFVYDEYLLALGVLLEVNGDYWHTLPGRPERDARKETWAREHGFIPMTIWEHEIKEHGALVMIQSRVGHTLDTELAQK